MPFRSPLRSRVVVAAVVAAVTAGTVSTAALAEPAPTIEQVTQQVAALEQEAQAAAERHRQAVAAVEQGKAELFEVERAAAATQARLTSSKRTAGQLAAASYRQGVIDPGMLQVIFSETPEDALHQAASVVRVMDQQNGLIERVTAVREELAEDEARLAQALRGLKESSDAAAREQQTVEQKRAAAAQLLATLQEEERRRAEEAARAAAAQQAAAREAAARQVADRGTPRASRSTSRAAAAPAAAVGGCPASGGRGAESGLTPATLSIMRCGLAAFPQVGTALGLGKRGNATDHDDGRAVDFMIPRYSTAAGNDLGWRVAEWATKQPNVDYVIFDQMIYGGWTGGWRKMENRGSDTANHRDHVHVSVSR